MIATLTSTHLVQKTATVRRLTGSDAGMALPGIPAILAVTRPDEGGVPRLDQPSAAWLPLLRQLTGTSDGWGVWKNADRALAGSGDVDSVAPADHHSRLAEDFHSWAADERYPWVIECRHVDGLLALVAVSHSTWAQLDLASETSFRGARLFSAEDLAPLMRLDDRGFRRVREGAEGFFLFLYKGTRWGGRKQAAALAKYKVLEKVRADWEGAVQAAGLLGRAKTPLIRAMRAAASGDWSTSSLVLAEATTLLRGIAEPGFLVSRATAKGWRLRDCQVLKAIAAGLRIASLPQWLDGVRENHNVVSTG
jgi:hypothetical protein